MKVLASITLVVILLVLVGTGINHYVYNNKYQQDVGSHLVRIQHMILPEDISVNIAEAKKHINEAFLPGDQRVLVFDTETTSVAYCLEYLDMVDKKASEVATWRNITYESNRDFKIDELGDVYFTKISNVTGLVSKADAYLTDAYYVKHSTWAYFSCDIYFFVCILLVLGFLIAAFRAFADM